MIINKVLKKYLNERKKELAPRTFNYYKETIDLISISFNHYGYLYLNEEQNERFDKECKQETEFCDFFGPEVLSYGSFSEFLSYFLPKKVIIGYDGAQKICSAGLNLYKWLVKNEYFEDCNLQMTTSELREEFKDSWEEFNKPF